VGTASVAPKDFPTKTNDDGTLTDEYGMIFKPMGLYNEFYKYPLENAESEEDIDNYHLN
jgi:hypothetical protein